MERTAKNLIKIAVEQIGYIEKESCYNLDSNTANAGDGNHTKYARDLHDAGYYAGYDKCGYAWCDVFVDWCFYTLCDKNAAEAQKMICQTGPYGAGCEFSARYYKNAGRFYTSNPMPGDQVFFGSTDIGHTGIVESVNGNTITTIEGNTSDRVARRVYNLSNTYIKGFGRPIYSGTVCNNTTSNSNATSNNSNASSNTTSNNNLDNGIYIVKSGDSWWGISEKFLGSGIRMNELAIYNNKTTKTMLHPGDRIKIPGKYSENNNTNSTTTSKPTTTKPVITGYDEENGTYTVQAGDGWWRIAAKTMGSGLKMYSLAKYNNMTISTMLHPGNVIRIPK